MTRFDLTFLLAAVFAMSIPSVFAQNSIVSDIRREYKEAKNAIAQQKEEPNLKRDIVLSTTQNVPGIGPQTFTYNLYLSDESETKVFFATVSYNIAAADFTEEYLFDMNGDLQFAYLSSYGNSDIKFHEYRLYYNVRDSQIVKVTEKEKDSTFRQVYDGDFTDFYTPQATVARERIKMINDIFEATKKTFEAKPY